ncbi:hypothetical protein HUU05_02235 [candidate division KSB1 bacterium]|nr:hypothetical protein [candidate division KSB1 bacterium]
MPTVNLNFASQDFDAHQCQGFRDGDWIIFRCEHCPDYERRMNWRTGAVQSRHAKAEIQHHGFYVPSQYQDLMQNLN